jgi:hypothetical protein
LRRLPCEGRLPAFLNREAAERGLEHLEAGARADAPALALPRRDVELVLGVDRAVRAKQVAGPR